MYIQRSKECDHTIFPPVYTHVYTGCEGEKIVYPKLFVPCITQGSKQVTSSSPVYTQGKNSVVTLFAPLYVYR